MKAVNLASYDFRGYEYYKEGKVISHEQISEGVYQGQVSSDNAVYNVMIDLNKVRNSSCDCPFDKSGTRFICKHIVALFFAIFPDDAVEYKAQIDKEQAEYEEWEEKSPALVEAYVCKLSKKELKEHLLDILFTADDWVLNRYIRDHDINDE